MILTLHKLPEGFIVTSDKPNDLGGLHFDPEFKFISNPSRYNVTDGMVEVIAQQDQIDFSGLSEAKQKEIGWFDIEKLMKKWVMDPKMYLWVKDFAKELLSDRMFSRNEVLRIISDMSIELSINPSTAFDDILKCGLNILQSISKQSWQIEGEWVEDKFKITEIK